MEKDKVNHFCLCLMELRVNEIVLPEDPKWLLSVTRGVKTNFLPQMISSSKGKDADLIKRRS